MQPPGPATIASGRRADADPPPIQLCCPFNTNLTYEGDTVTTTSGQRAFGPETLPGCSVALDVWSLR